MNIVVFGELPIATKIVQHLESLSAVNVPCVVCENYDAKNADPWADVPMLYEYAKERGIPVISLADLEQFCINLNSKPVIGITARFSKILKSPHLKSFEHGVINLHGGLLPEFAGLYSVNHMLLSGIKTGGGSIHWVDLGIDTGHLIRRCICEIDDSDTAFSLHQKIQRALFDGTKAIIDEGVRVGFDKIKEEPAPSNSVTKYYSRNSLDGLKEIDYQTLSDEKALRIIRAFDFPKHEPAYTIINGKKVYLRVNSL